MKWSVAILVLFGLIAAAAAAVLAGALKAGGGRSLSSSNPLPPGAQVEVLVATRDLQPMGMVDSGAVVKKWISREMMEDNYLTNPVQVVGHVLAVGIKKDAVYTHQHFVGKNAAVLASAVKQGKRAVTLALSPDAAMTNLLYPGCIVDVLATFEAPTQDNQDTYAKKETITVTVLQAVQVMAVEDKTVMSEGEAKAPGGGQYSQRRNVTLLVAPKEAEQLQTVKASHGEISLTMRNPMETGRMEEGSATSISQISDLFRGRMAPSMIVESNEPASTERPQWSVVVLHGNTIEKQTFELKE
jgi:Flp pilus assembly protein CpaB